jgi:hypothetical protein
VRLAAALPLLLLVAACGKPTPEPTTPAPASLPAAASPSASVPASGELNPYVVEVMASYPTDGTHAYWWPKKSPWSGNARTLRYAGDVLLEGDAQGRAYCCGLTFEVFLQAWEAWCQKTGRPYRIKDYTKDDVLKLKHAWFGSNGDRSTIHGAITSRGLGTPIVAWDDARPGDFIQLWRHSGSGHSVIFKDWVREHGEIVGLTYWSVQGSTNGIGKRTERFADPGVKRDEFYIVRIGI